jgi:hypothetical protein
MNLKNIHSNVSQQPEARYNFLNISNNSQNNFFLNNKIARQKEPITNKPSKLIQIKNQLNPSVINSTTAAESEYPVILKTAVVRSEYPVILKTAVVRSESEYPVILKTAVVRSEHPVILKTAEPESPSVITFEIPKSVISKKDNKKLTYVVKNVYIVSNILGGGSIKYLDDLRKQYINVNFVHIKNKASILAIRNPNPYDILFVQQLLWCDILPQDVINIKHKFATQIVISVHDFCWFIEDENINNPKNNVWEQGYLLNISQINSNILQLFEEASIVIHPSEFTQNHYSRFFPTHNSILQPHNDIELKYPIKQIPRVKNNNTINIGNFQGFSPYKGKKNVNLLFNAYHNKKYKGHIINFMIVGKNIPAYEESNWQDEMIKHHFHCLLHLNKYGETYSYALSKSLNSGLPILYNNIGAFKERIPNTKEEDKRHYIKVIEHESKYDDCKLLFEKFEEMLDYIIENNGTSSDKSNRKNVIENRGTFLDKSNRKNMIVYKELYNYLFETREFNREIYTKVHEKIKPFAVYFPQFHSIAENDLNYYKGMTDITNLDFYNKNETDKLDTPSLTELNLSTLLDYDLTNKEIINRQIDIAKQYGIYGFAIYYYWFSENTITNKNTIMEKSYDLFFKQTIGDFKVFFVWANENWTNNVAFNTKETIINEYNLDNFITNIDHLMEYFKHPNYYKIDNKPVFYIHHPFVIDTEQLHLFKYLLEQKCIQSGFDGSLLVLNNLAKSYEDFNEYNFHPNYKKNKSLNYEEYIKTHVNSSSTSTIFFDFNNTARLYIPNRLKFKSVYTNNSIYLQDKYIKKVLEQYKSGQPSELNKILLINSWNEWGENMAIEPSEMNGYKYLLLLKSNLLLLYKN